MPYSTYLATGLMGAIINLGLTPIATLATDASSGSGVITVTDPVQARRFRPDTPLFFNDGTGEPLTTIDTVKGTEVTLKWPGRSYEGTRFDHLAGSQITTNIYRTFLSDVTAHFANGYPVWGIYVLDNTKRWRTNKRWQNHAVASILYQLPILRGDAALLDDQIWLQETLDRAEGDVSTLVAWLQKNSTIPVGGSHYAFNVIAVIESRRTNVTDPKLPVFEILVDLQIEGLHEDIDPTD